HPSKVWNPNGHWDFPLVADLQYVKGDRQTGSETVLQVLQTFTGDNHNAACDTDRKTRPLCTQDGPPEPPPPVPGGVVLSGMTEGQSIPIEVAHAFGCKATSTSGANLRHIKMTMGTSPTLTATKKCDVDAIDAECR